ncbi:uncharacterized protein PHALS_11763 [Plasmopara halstedii]|uniref:Uncharacterized protein n=1 Tax=Plasmopara halstedii TaxID=4781 RepID=A0A0P1AL43_PLAHL|nr:uncharacterized protein PHALS_11763 [Plasmopara halstedii]CEG41414.1 hypothetical protein PHALS_11763 [Plasmopara halstedii]|eukprot:XP_024577783.1 hypothetical protein PHALS_11763 [Plasmopara halstedii]
MEEERVVLETRAIAQEIKLMESSEHVTQNVNKGLIANIKQWYSGLCTIDDLKTVKQLLDAGSTGYDKAILQGFTPSFVEIMVRYGKLKHLEKDLPSRSDIVEFSKRYSDLLGVPETTDEPASLNAIWPSGLTLSSLVDDIRRFYQV